MKDFTNHVLKKHKKILIIFTVQWICTIICGLVSFLYMGTWIQNMINQSLVTSPQSDLYELWKNPPVNPVLSIYLFNFTNAHKWMNGTDEKLKVQELGPYCYQEIWKKKNVVFNK